MSITTPEQCLLLDEGRCISLSSHKDNKGYFLQIYHEDLSEPYNLRFITKSSMIEVFDDLSKRRFERLSQDSQDTFFLKLE